MNGRLVPGSRWVVVAALVAPLSLALAAPQPAVAAAKKTEKTETEYKQVAQVKVEIKQESGKVIKTKGTVDFGAQGTLALAGDDHSHSVHLKVDRSDDSKPEVQITLGYDRDGEAIIAPYSFDTKVKKREVIQIEGGIAIALHVTPKKVAVEAPPPEDKPEEREEKLELEGDNNDPLGGL